MNKETIFNIDKNETTFLKGIAILLVIIGHMGYIYKGGSWGASLFLMLSGYGIFKSYIKNNNKKYFSKKILKVYLPYALVTAVIIVYNYMKFRIGKKQILFSLLGLDFGFICDKTMWFVSFIFVQYIIFYISALVFKKIKNENLKHSLLILLSFILSYLVFKLDEKYLIWGRGAGVYLYVFSFEIGLVISKLSYIKINKNIKRALLSFASFSLITLIIILINCADTILKYCIYANALPLLLIILVSLKLVKCKNKLILYIGEISYDVYLWEGFLLIIGPQLLAGLNNNVLINLCIIALCISISKVYKNVIVDPITSFICNIKKK